MIEWLTPAAVWGSLKAVPPVAAFVEKYRLSRVARNLAVLTFWNDGMTAPLKRIAGGQGQQSDLDEIAARLRQTEGKVTQAADRLRAARDNLVSTKLGMSVARELDFVIYEKVGPGAIRPQLTALARSGQLIPEHAAGVVQRIDECNRFLDHVHELIRPKSKELPATQRQRRRI